MWVSTKSAVANWSQNFINVEEYVIWKEKLELKKNALESVVIIIIIKESVYVKMEFIFVMKIALWKV